MDPDAGALRPGDDALEDASEIGAQRGGVVTTVALVAADLATEGPGMHKLRQASPSKYSVSCRALNSLRSPPCSDLPAKTPTLSESGYSQTSVASIVLSDK